MRGGRPIRRQATFVRTIAARRVGTSRPVMARASTEVLRFAQDDKALVNSTFVQEDVMQMVITFMAVVAGLIFSVAVALLAEEFIFGQVFRVFFVRRAVPMKAEQKR